MGSGLAINATVGLIAKSQTTLSLVVSAPKFVKINDVLNSEETVPSTYGGTNWRRMVLPDMVKENPMLIPHPEACPEKKFYEVIRTVDFTNCEKSSTFSFIRPGHFFQGQQSEIISRSSNTRYIACGSGSTGLTIQHIVNDGEFNFQLMGTKTEKVVSGSLQTLRLKEVKAVSGSSIPMPVNPVTLKTLMFEYTEKAYGLTTGSLVSGSGSEELLKEGRIPSSQVNNGKVLAKAIPKTMFQGLNSETTPSKSEFVNEIAKILKNVMLVVRGESTEKLTETQVNMLLLTAVRGMTTLESVQEIEILYTTLVNGLNKDQSETMRQLFLDTVVMTGTPHSVEFFEKMVREGKATTHEINSFFMFLPRYIMTPTQQVLKRLFKLVTEVESIKTVPTTYSLAMTGLTQLVHSACIAEDRKTSCPVNVFGEFCTPESKIVQEVLIPHLARALHQTPTTVLEENIRNIHIMSH